MRKLLLLVIPAMMLWGTNSIAQTSLEFDGVDNYIDAGQSYSLTSYTKEVWIYWDGQTTFLNQIMSGQGNNLHMLYAPGNKNNIMRSGHNGLWNYVEDTIPMPINEWTHYAVTFDGTTGEMALFRNGVEVDRYNDPENYDPNFALTNLSIGASTIFPNEGHFGGLIDEVRLWDHVRTPQQISDNYQACTDPTASGLVMYYDFEDGAGSSTAADMTGNGNDGTLVNFDIVNEWADEGIVCDDVVDPDPIEITSFYPNPTWNRVYLNLNGTYNYLQVRVYNRYGYFVRGKNVNGPTDSVFATLYGLRRGYYYVMVINRETWEYDYVRVYKRGWY